MLNCTCIQDEGEVADYLVELSLLRGQATLDSPDNPDMNIE